MQCSKRCRPRAAPPDAAGGERKVLYWHDPMFPGSKGSTSRASRPSWTWSSCRSTRTQAATSAGVASAPRMAQNLGVRTARRAAGHRLASERRGRRHRRRRTSARRRRVQSRVAGYVEKLFVRATLDPVATGQPLVEIFAPEWARAPGGVPRARRKANAGPGDRARGARSGCACWHARTTSSRSSAKASRNPRVHADRAASPAWWRARRARRHGWCGRHDALPHRRPSTVWVTPRCPEAQAALRRPGCAGRGACRAYPGRVRSRAR